MINAFLVKDDNTFEYVENFTINHDELAALKFYWLDIFSLSNSEAKTTLNSLDFHDLAIIDALRERHPPKIEAFEDHVYILFKALNFSQGSFDFDFSQVSLFIGEKYIISYHLSPSQDITEFQKSASNLKEFISGEITAHLLYALSERYLQELLNFEEGLYEIEEKLAEELNDEDMKKLVIFRSELIKINRTFNYHLQLSDTLCSFANNPEIPIFVDDAHRITDLHERTERIQSLGAMYYTICCDLLDGYLSLASHQLNNTMKVLTVITAIFIPLGFLSGLYGMNFEYMPELKFHYGYPILISFMFCIVITLLVFFKKRRWL